MEIEEHITTVSSRLDEKKRNIVVRTLTKQSWKWRRSKEPPMRRSLYIAVRTTLWIVDKACGQELS
jgi:hypothetical protein